MVSDTQSQPDKKQSDLENGYRICKLSGHVGLGCLADQLMSKVVSQGFQFNILCVGETGLGKSTLMETLFNRTFDSIPTTHNLEQVKLRSKTYDLHEGNVRLRLTLTETAGFGDQINKNDSYKPIVDFIDAQFENYLQEEMKVRRNMRQFLDSRVHLCLYFIPPTGHSMKALDIYTLNVLQSKVNIIPLIAKADTITRSELQKFKAKIRQELADARIQIYQFPETNEDEGELNSQMNQALPFAIVGSSDEVRVNNRNVRARQYPWGTVQVDNESHCDFKKLREAVLRVNMLHLVDTTHARHYSLYRQQRMTQLGFADSSGSFSETVQQKRQELQAALQKREQEMREAFIIRVKEKEAEIKEQEKLIQQKYDQSRARHTQLKRQLDDEAKRCAEERQAFDQRKRDFYAKMDKKSNTMKKK